MNDACARRAEEAWIEDLDDPVSGPVSIDDLDDGSESGPRLVEGPAATWGLRTVTADHAARAEEITRAYEDRGADPFADTVASFAPGGALRKPEWCVDLGVVLLTMTTFELWTSVERGDVPAETRVWREGMECWTSIGRLPEFSWAVPGAKSPAPLGALEVGVTVRTPSAMPEAADATTGPAVREAGGDLRGDEREDEREIDDERPAGVPTGRWWMPWGGAKRRAALRGVPRGAKWIALGSAVAVCAILTALLAGAGHGGGADGSEERPDEVVAWVGAEVGGHAVVSEVSEGRPRVNARAATMDEPRVQHEEPGRHRLRRGGKRGAGW
jgi:hypothetical protein